MTLSSDTYTPLLLCEYDVEQTSEEREREM